MFIPHQLCEQPDNISLEESAFWSYIVVGNNKKYIDLHVKGQIFQLILTNLDWKEIFFKEPIAKFYGNPSSGRHMERGTDEYDGASRFFLSLCERT